MTDRSEADIEVSRRVARVIEQSEGIEDDATRLWNLLVMMRHHLSGAVVLSPRTNPDPCQRCEIRPEDHLVFRYLTKFVGEIPEGTFCLCGAPEYAEGVE